MKHSFILTSTAAIGIMAVAFINTRGQSSPNPLATTANDTNSRHARGTLEVTVKTMQSVDTGADDHLARMSLDKQFAGDLVGTGKGEMLSAGTEVKGSAGYVAMEKVVGTLDGRKGSFILQHSATMNRGAPQLTITVVPDSGTEGLTGLAGRLQIDIKDGKHFYDFE